ncbi:VacJ family lipoprotein [Halopseudomonas laoshanensis]|jgi:phospholipid-binding lipoprotein MlaA|uniref:MlaA family lipoprotein n=1 Tax=Halopseudomonas TaxID=2901189 RepID=UPI00373667F9
MSRIPVRKQAFLVAVLSGLLLTPAMVNAQDTYADESANADPWEPVNRVIFRFNDTLDTYTLKPIAKTYDRFMPQPLDDGISNVFGNLGEPRNLVNNTLQGKFRDAGVDMARFLLNTTVGVVGVFDVATRMGLQRNDEDFGQTLGAWGVSSGPYVVLPLLGPSTVRDGGARVPEALANYSYSGQIDHVPTRNTALGTDLVDTRASLLAQEKMIRGDRYNFIRNAFLQNREFKVQDGDVEDTF